MPFLLRDFRAEEVASAPRATPSACSTSGVLSQSGAVSYNSSSLSCEITLATVASASATLASSMRTSRARSACANSGAARTTNTPSANRRKRSGNERNSAPDSRVCPSPTDATSCMRRTTIWWSSSRSTSASSRATASPNWPRPRRWSALRCSRGRFSDR